MQNYTSILRNLKTDGIRLGLAELVRYQQLARQVNLKPLTPPKAMMSGAYLTRAKGRGMEFDEARHYLPGDDIRAIDWRVTARTGKTHTKIYREERERPVFILCDLSYPMQFGSQLLLKSVQAAHTAAMLSWAASERGDKVGALIFNDAMHRECKPLSRKRAVLSLCHQLQRIQTMPVTAPNPTALGDACQRLRRLAKPGSLVYLISDFQAMQPQVEQHLTQLARHCEVHAIRIYDPLETSLPEMAVSQQVNVTDGQQTQEWQLGDKQLAERYARWRSDITSALNQRFKQARIVHHDISASQPLDAQTGIFRSSHR